MNDKLKTQRIALFHYYITVCTSGKHAQNEWKVGPIYILSKSRTYLMIHTFKKNKVKSLYSEFIQCNFVNKNLLK